MPSVTRSHDDNHGYAPPASPLKDETSYWRDLPRLIITMIMIRKIIMMIMNTMLMTKHDDDADGAYREV